MMKNLKNWTEVTRGLYRYVIAAKVCYELHILHWDFETDILTAKASVYLVGNWAQSNGNSFFERIAFQGSETGTWEWYWLQNKVEDSAFDFAGVYNAGGAYYYNASNSRGVRPVFLLS